MPDELSDLVDAVILAMFDTCICPVHGERSKSKGEVIQQGSSYLCSECKAIAEEVCTEEIPF